MWTFSFYLGNFVGPTVAGFLVERRGFRWAASAYFGLFMLMVAADLVDIAFKAGKKMN